MRRSLNRVIVLVQGDLGRSPRMQYHAYALAVNGIEVDLVGSAGTALAPQVLQQRGITCHVIGDGAPAPPGRGYLHAALARAARQTIHFGHALSRLADPDLLLVQTPPSAPVGPIAWTMSRWRRARLVLDWHNLGWTMLALKTGHGGVANALRAAERWMAPRADGHICVSRALRDHLARVCGVDANVVYDRPPEWFTPPTASVRAGLRATLLRNAGLPPERSLLIVSPTSWTPDEDVDLLLRAADIVERRAVAGDADFDVLLFVSGTGPGRAAFEAQLNERQAGARVQIRTGWVEPSEYPSLIAAADAGICVHRSSSGLDLPMKIADMFGVGLPVIALRYASIGEVVRDGDNGVLFDDAEGLATAIARVASAVHHSPEEYTRWRTRSADSVRERWTEVWRRDALPVLCGERAL